MVEMERWDEVVVRRTRQQTRMLSDGVSGRRKRKSVVREPVAGEGEKAGDLSGSRGTSTVGRRTSAQFARSGCSVAECGDDRDIALERCTGKKIGMMRCGGRKRKSRGDSEVVLLGTETRGVSDCNVEDDFSVDKKVTDEVEEEAGVMPATQAPSCVARRTRSQFQKLTSGIMKAGGNEPGGSILIDDSDENSDGMKEEKDEEDIMKDGEDVDNSIFVGNGKDKRDEDDLGQNSFVGGEAVGSLRNIPVAMPLHTPHQIKILCDEVSGKRRKLEDDSTKDDSTSNTEIGEVEEKNRDSSDSLEPSCVAHRTRSQFATSKCGGTKAGDNSSENVIQIDDEDGEGNSEEDDDMGDVIKGDKDKEDSVDGESRGDESKDDDSNKHMSISDCNVEDDSSVNKKVTDEVEEETGVMPATQAPTCVARRTRSQFQKLTSGIMKAGGNKPGVSILIDDADENSDGVEEEKDEEDIMKDGEDVDNSIFVGNGKDKRDEDDLGQNSSVGGEAVGSLRNMPVAMPMHTPPQIKILCDEVSGKGRKLEDDGTKDDSTSNREIGEVEEKNRDSSDSLEPSCIAHRTRSQFVKSKCCGTKAGDNSSENVIQIDDEDGEGIAVEDDDMGDVIKGDKDKEDSVDGESRENESKDDDSNKHMSVDGVHSKDSEEDLLMSCSEKENDDLKNKDLVEKFENSVCRDEMASISVKKGEKGKTVVRDIVDFKNVYEVRKMPSGIKRTRSSVNVSSYSRVSQPPMCVARPMKLHNIKRGSDFTEAENNRLEDLIQIVDDGDSCDDDDEEVEMEKEEDEEKEDIVKGCNVMKDSIEEDNSEDDLRDHSVEEESCGGDEYGEGYLMDDSVEESSEVEYDEDDLMEYTPVDGKEGDDSEELLLFSTDEENDDLSSDMENEFSVDASADILRGRMPACIARRTRSHFKTPRSDILRDGTFSNPCCLDSDEDDQNIALHDNNISGMHKDLLGGKCRSFEFSKRNPTFAREGGDECDGEDDQNIALHDNNISGMHKDLLGGKCRSFEINKRNPTFASEGGDECGDEDDQNIALHYNNISGMHKDLLGGKCRSFEINKRNPTFASEGGDECGDEDDQNIALHDNNIIGMHKDLLGGKCRSFEFNKRNHTFASEGGDECGDEDDQNIALHDNNSSGMHKDLLVGKRRSFEFSKRELASASEGGVDCMQIPKSLGEEGRPDGRLIKRPNDTRKIQLADSACENRDECRQKSDGQGRYDDTPFKRKHIRQAYDARKVLLEAIWGQRDSLQDSIGIVIPKVARITNWKFTFDEESQPVEKSEAELEFDKLWMEFEFCLRSCEIESGNADMVENEDLLQPRLDPCIWGSHDAILDEEIGFKCRHCSIILQEIRDVVAPFRKDPVERYVKRDFGRLDDDFFRNLPTESITNDLNDGFPSDHDGTVWDLIPGIKCALYPHQREGFEFIWKNVAGTVNLSEARRLKESNDGSGCIISHAPGTGKSRLTIVFLQAYLRFFPDCRPVIIAPKSMLLTWEDEFKKWNVDFPFHNVNNNELSGKEDAEALAVLARLKYGSPRKEILRMVKLYSWKCQSSVLGISYTLFEKLTFGRASEEDDQSEGNVLLKLPGVLVLDEGHTPRNNDTLIWQALSSVRTQKRICLSGTPFQNNFDELFNTFCMARPRFASTMSHWNKGNDIKRRGHKPNAVKANWANFTNSICENNVEELQNLKAMISPFVHVYTGNVLRDTLPGLSQKIIYLRPGSLQKSLLQRGNGIVNIMERRHIVSLISVHPSLLLQHSSFVTGESFPEVRELKGMQLTPQDGVKTKFLIDFLRLTVALKEKVLVFSDYIDPLLFLKDQLKSCFSWTEGEEILYMDGKLDVKQRQASISVFNEEGSNVKVLLASKKACCEGISLVGASRVVFLDAAWNPSVQRQAISRAYRLGQKKFVYVYHLITFATIEEDVYRIQMRKDRISNMVFPSAKGTDINCHWNSSEGPEDKILLEMLEHSTITNLIEKVV